MEHFRRLGDVPYPELAQSLKDGCLEMSLGPFSKRLKANNSQVTEFLQDAYRDVPVRTKLGDITDVAVTIKSPSWFRQYVRRQVVADPGFIVPAVPLPVRLSALSFEMGLNLAVALKCCRLVSFHAAVVGNEKGAIFISAHSGGGKSTLASALMVEGYRLFSDEFGLLDMSNSLLVPYPRPVSLKGDSINIVRDFTGADWLTPVLSDTPKGDIAYRRARPSDIEEADKKLSSKLIVFPVFTKGARPVAKELAKSEALMRLIPSSTNYHLLGQGGFEALTAMVAGARSYEIQYGNTDDSMKIVKDLAAGVGL
ncbi:MAG: HprK-related kinase A [Kordiimonadales bacterium]|nr:MAG: HprK-related kinase A [Kordiimonadales bacterium]